MKPNKRKETAGIDMALGGAERTVASTPHKCPCCDGWGKRPSIDGMTLKWIDCPACDNGIVWLHETKAIDKEAK